MKSKWLVGIAVGSILLNVALVGAFATHWFRRGPFDGRGGRGPLGQGSMVGLPLFRATVHAAGGPLDGRVRAIFREHIRDARGLRQQLLEARERAEQALRQEPFDAAVARAALEELAKTESLAGTRANQATLELLGKMSVDERNQVHKFFHRPLALPEVRGAHPRHHSVNGSEEMGP